MSATTAFAQSIFDQPLDERPVELQYVRLRINEIEKQIADRLNAEAKITDTFTAQAMQADVSYRILARNLLKLGLDAGPDGAVAVVHGHTLADHADEVQAMFMKLPGLVQQLKQQSGNLDQQLVDRIITIEKQLASFTAKTKAAALTSAVPADVDRALQDLLAPVAEVAKQLGEKPPVNTWLAPSADEQAMQVRIDDVYLQDLERRINASPLVAATRTELRNIVTMLRRGMDHPDLRPRAAAMLDTVELALVAGEDLKAVAWLGESTMNDFREQVQTAIGLVKDPRTRDAGAKRLAAMVDHLTLARRLSQLKEMGAATDRLRDLFLAAHNQAVQSRDLRTAETVIEFLDGLTATMLEYRQQPADEDHPQFRPVLVALRSAYQSAELSLVNDTAALVADPAKISEVAWDSRRVDLEERMATIRRVAAIPAWVEQMSRHKPKPTGGLFRHLRLVANDLLDESHRAEADRKLADLQRQVEQFEPMHFENEIAAGGEAVQAATDGVHVLLLEQIERLRHDWATAWASGKDPLPAAGRLRQLGRLLRAIELAGRLDGLPAAMNRLNRWAGWQTPPQALAPMLEALPGKVQQASRFAGAGDWPALEASLDQLAAEMPLALLAGHLHDELMPGLEKLPTGATGVLSQTMYGPRSDSFQASNRLALAQISVYLVEAAHARAHDQKPQADLAIAHVKRLAGKLSSH